MIIETSKTLIKHCKILRKKKVIFIDTEFDRRSTYYSKLSFITISDGKKIIVIDCLSKEISLDPLKIIINNKKITKVIHGSQQDLEIFKNMKIKIHSIFDTQTAAQFCGYENSPSYANLVHDICKIKIDKKLQNSDWLKRPITKNMNQYLSLDVKYLKEIYKYFCKKLLKNKNFKYFNEEMKNINQESVLITSSIIRKKISYHNIKQKKFQNILKFRNEIAQKKNIPKNWIFKDDNITNIIENKKFFVINNNHNLNKDEKIKLIKNFKKINFKNKKKKTNINTLKIAEIIKNEISKKNEISEQLISSKSELKQYIENGIKKKSKWRNRLFYSLLDKIYKKGIKIKINKNNLIIKN